MAAGTVTPPPLQEVKGPTAKERRYDRQLRLWAASGQQALEEAHILLLNGGTGVTGVETLKNLVLPGMGAFTIVDPAEVHEEDLGVNFFLEEASLGRSRAEECARLLVELNPDVQGKGVKQVVTDFITSADLSKYTLILVSGPAVTADLASIRSKAFHLSIPLVQVSCAGFYSMFSLQLPRQFPIVDTHPDPASTQDLRILSPWPELSELAASKTTDLEKMSDHDHGHVPYLLLLLHFIEQWKASHEGKLPTAYKDKTAFRELVRAAARTSNPEGGEENFDEACAAVLKTLNEAVVPSGLRAIFAEKECQSPSASDADFWYIAHAIKAFADAHGNVLPLPGGIPDMKAQSKDYIELQNVYKAKARADVAWVSNKVRELESKLRQHESGAGDGAGQGKTPIDGREIEAFCKGAAHVRLIQGRSPGLEGVEPRWAQIASGLADGEGGGDGGGSLMHLAVAFEAQNGVLGGGALETATRAADVPEMLRQADADEGAAAMESFVDGYLDRVVAGVGGDGGGEFDVAQAKIGIMLRVQELRRSGPAELHNIASLTGGMVAQEIIKVITKQYVPVDNTCVFDGIESRSAVFRL